MVLGGNRGNAEEMEEEADRVIEEAEMFVPEIEQTNREMSRELLVVGFWF